MNKSHCLKCTYFVSVRLFFLEPVLTFSFISQELMELCKTPRSVFGERNLNSINPTDKTEVRIFLVFWFLVGFFSTSPLCVTVSGTCDKTYKDGQCHHTEVCLHETPPSSCAGTSDEPEDETCGT